VDHLEAPEVSIPSDGIFAGAARLVPEGRWRIVSEEAGFAGPFLLVALFAGAFVEMARQEFGTTLWDEAASPVIGTGVAVLSWLCWRFVWPGPKRRLLGRVDEAALQRLVLAEALLANEQAGLANLTPGEGSLVIVPSGGAKTWPADSPEDLLLRRRKLEVAQLLAEARSVSSLDLFDLADQARRRGVLWENPARSGPLLVPTESVLAPAAGATLGEVCRAQRPVLWSALQAAIEDGLERAPAQPVASADEEAALPRQLYVEAEEPKDVPPRQSLIVELLFIFALWIGMAYGLLGSKIFGGNDAGAATLTPWPAALAVAIVLATALDVLKMRKPLPAEPLPQYGSPDEEAELARARLRRNTVSGERLPWSQRLTGGLLLGGVLGCLTTFLPAYLFLGLIAFVGVALYFYLPYRRLPTSRELQLAVARRSRELTAAMPQPAASSRPAPAAGSVAARPSTLITPDTLPPAMIETTDPLDRRRAVAVQALHWHLWSASLLALGMGALTTMLWWYSDRGKDPEILLFPVILLGVPTFFCWREAVSALHALRPRPWAEMPGAIGASLRLLARLLRLLSVTGATGTLPDASRSLNGLLSLQPDFWRNSTLRLAAPLGLWPWALAGVCLAGSILLALIGLLGSRPAFGLAGVIGFAFVGGYVLAWRRWRRRLEQRAAAQAGERLVLLRVFGSPSFDDLLDIVRPWLLRGPISHLEGYDSISRSIMAGKALVEGRLDDVLVSSPEQIARHLAADSTLPDRELRYRRDAFQCIDAVWQPAIRELLDRSDIVLMDLSSLSPKNAGCAYELGLLLDRVPLSKLVLLVNDTTDLDCLHGLLAAADTQIAPDSPNRAEPREPWQLLRIGGLAARGSEESLEDWLRRLDMRLQPLQLVRYLGQRMEAAAARFGSSSTALSG